MTILREQAEKILYASLEARVGLQLLVHEDGRSTVTPSLRVKQILYRFRKEIGDIELMQIQIRLCPHDPDKRLWTTKTELLVPKPRPLVTTGDSL